MLLWGAWTIFLISKWVDLRAKSVRIVFTGRDRTFMKFETTKFSLEAHLQTNFIILLSHYYLLNAYYLFFFYLQFSDFLWVYLIFLSRTYVFSIYLVLVIGFIWNRWCFGGVMRLAEFLLEGVKFLLLFAYPLTLVIYIFWPIRLGLPIVF